MRILLATTRNISAAGGEWRLLSERALGLRANSVATDVLSIRPAECHGSNEPLRGWAGQFAPISYRGLAGFAPALFKALIAIRRWLRRQPGGYVILSGAHLYPLAAVLPAARVVIDIHGTLAEWIELKHPSGKLRLLRYLYPLVRILECLALKRSRGALVVSRPLRDDVLSRGARAAWTVPCLLSAATARAFHVADREASRRELGIGPETTAVVYSGGLSEWQCTSEAVSLFSQLRPFLPGGARLIMITPNSPAASGIARAAGVFDPIVLSLPPGEVPAALAACDIGLMLREDTLTNRYAFPNKFAEYLAAGLYVLSSPGLPDPARLIREHSLGSILTPAEVRHGVEPERLAGIAREFAGASREMRLERIRPLAGAWLSMENAVQKLVSSLDGQDAIPSLRVHQRPAIL